MDSIRVRQYKNISELYRDIASKYNTVLSNSSLKSLQNEIIYSKSKEPKSGHYFVEDKLDLKSLNTEIGLMMADYKTLMSFLEDYIGEVSDIKYISQLWYSYILNIINSVSTKIDQINETNFIEGNTRIIDFNSEIAESSNIEVRNNNIVLSKTKATEEYYNVSQNDANIKPYNTESLKGNFKLNVLGKINEIFNITESQTVNMEILSDESYEIGYQITANVVYKNINSIILEFGSSVVSIKVKVEISENSNKWNNVFEGIVNSDNIDIRFNEIDIYKIRITLLRDTPNIRSGSVIKYTFNIKSVKFLNEISDNSSYFVTSKIDVDKDTSYAILVSDHELTPKDKIDYYISNTELEDGSPTAFTYIEPNDSNYKIDFSGVISSLNLVATNNEWKIPFEIKYDNRVYNLLNSNVSSSSSDVYVEDNQLKCDEEYEILSNKIKLYRGIDDYILKEEALEENLNNINIYHKVVSDDSGWVKKIDLLIRGNVIIETLTLNTSTQKYDTIKLNTKISNPSNIEFIRDDGESIKPQLIDFNDDDDNSEYTLVFDYGFDPSHIYTLYGDFNAYEYCQKIGYDFDMDIDTMNVSLNSEVLESGDDYIFNIDTLQIELYKGGYYGENISEPSDPTILSSSDMSTYPPIVISYTCLLSSETPIKYYETNVYVDKESSVIIKPFSDIEISRRNFHKIDDIDVSRITKYKLSSGWHVVKTTQPYPCLEGREINYYTSKHSTAGIIFTNIDSMYAYKNSLRKLSLFNLINMPRIKSFDCFAYENGGIYVTFQPDYVNEKELVNSNRTIHNGTTFTCRKPKYNENNENIGYEPHPEILSLDVPLKDSNTDKFIYIRSEINRSPIGNIKINRVGLNLINE